MKIATLLMFLFSATILLPKSLLAVSPNVEWINQFGTSTDDGGWDVTVDSLGDIYITGYTKGSLEGANAGSSDAFVSKYNSNGTLLWTEQFGSIFPEEGLGITTDGLGNVFISGYTLGSLDGSPNSNHIDAFVSKFDSSGIQLWTKQRDHMLLGVGWGVSTDSLGNAYVSGISGAFSDAYISKYDTDGTLLWTEEFAIGSKERSTALSTDGLGNVYITGFTDGNLDGVNSGGNDAFLRKYDTDGNHLWTKQLGTFADDHSFGIEADSLGNVFITGDTQGSLAHPNVGGIDTFVSKYDSSGMHIWTEQLGSTSDDRSFDVSADGLGNLYITGITDGSLEGASLGGRDAFVSKYDTLGNLLWTGQIGTSDLDYSQGVSADGLGNVYITGYTEGNLGGANVGLRDIFLAKLSDPIPEPSTLLLGVLSIAGCSMGRRFSKNLR